MSLQLLFEKFNQVVDRPESIKEIRDLILQLAVQGKLVPQDPNDEPASVLLEKIKAEKEKLIKEGKIKKEKPLLPINPDEVPFEVPVGWEWVRLGSSVLKLTDGTHHSPPNLPTGEFLYISAKNIKERGISLDNVTYVSQEVHEEIYARCNPEFGDVLYIKDGATTGIATINQLEQPFSMLSSVALLKPPEQLTNSFLLYSLRSPFFYQEMREGMSGVAITRVTLRKLNLALIALPPLAEQHRIVEKVDQLMGICDELEDQLSQFGSVKTDLTESAVHHLMEAPTKQEFNRHWTFIRNRFDTLFDNPENIKKLKQAILQLAVQGKLVPQDPNDEPASVLLEKIKAEKEGLVKAGKIKKEKPIPPIDLDEVPFEVPVGWEWVRLGYTGSTNIGLTFSPNDVGDEGIPVLRANNILNGRLDLSNLKRVKMEVKESVLVHEGNLLICARSGSRSLVGKACQLQGLSEPMAFGAFMAIFRSRANSYLLAFINSPLFRRMIDEVNTVTINQITQNNLRSTVTPRYGRKLCPEIKRA